MDDFRPLGIQISESLRAITNQMRPLQSPMFDAIRQFQSQYANFISPSTQFANILQNQLKFIVPIDYGRELAKALKPYSSLAEEFSKANKLLIDQFKFQIPEIKFPIDPQMLEGVRQSSALAAMHIVKHNQIGKIQLSNEILSRINEITSEVREGKEVNGKSIDGIIQTLNGIEATLKALESKLATPSEKLFTIEDIRFYIALILSLVLFVIPYLGQIETDEKIDHIEQESEKNSGRLEEVSDKLDNIIDLLARQEKWICSRDTYLRSKPSFRSASTKKIFQFETVIVDNTDSIVHKWIRVKFVDTKENQIKIGWVPKKYFKRIE